MQTANDILKDKGRAVWSVKPTNTVLEALGVMAEHDIGAVLVMDDDKLVGVLTERDYARKVVLAGRSSKESQVKEVMTAHVVCVAPERSVDECMALMTNKRAAPLAGGRSQARRRDRVDRRSRQGDDRRSTVHDHAAADVHRGLTRRDSVDVRSGRSSRTSPSSRARRSARSTARVLSAPSTGVIRAARLLVHAVVSSGFSACPAHGSRTCSRAGRP